MIFPTTENKEHTYFFFFALQLKFTQTRFIFSSFHEPTQLLKCWLTAIAEPRTARNYTSICIFLEFN